MLLANTTGQHASIAAAQLRAATPTLKQLAPGLAFGIFSGASAVLLIALSAFLITRAAEQPPILYLGLIVVGVRAFALSRACFRYLERLSSHDAAFRALGDIRAESFHRLEPLAPARLGSRKRGDLLTRLVTDVDQLVDWPTRVIQPLATSATVIIATLIAMAFFSPAAALVLAAALAVALILGTLVSVALTDRAERRTATLRGTLADAVAELVAEIDVLVAYGAADAQLKRVERADAQLKREALRSAAGTSLVGGVLAAATGAAIVGILLVGLPGLVASEPLAPGFRLDPGVIDGPVLAMLVLVPLVVFEIFAAIPLAWTARRRVLASAQRIASISAKGEIAAAPAENPGHLEAKPQIRRKAQRQETDPVVESEENMREGTPIPRHLSERSNAEPNAPRIAGYAGAGTETSASVLALQDFAVYWPGATKPVSAPVSCTLKPGENLLITGASGTGKTALAYGLVGFLESTGGYLVNGTPAAELTAEQLRSRVCLIEQDAHLFTGTLRANLALAHPDGPEAATDDELINVLQSVGLWEWAQQRDGLETEVGMFGSLISGGQAQRVAVARGLLSGAEVLVLDEPTAHVDPAAADLLIAELLGGIESADGTERSVVVLSHIPVPEEFIDHRIRVSPAT